MLERRGVSTHSRPGVHLRVLRVRDHIGMKQGTKKSRDIPLLEGAYRQQWTMQGAHT